MGGKKKGYGTEGTDGGKADGDESLRAVVVVHDGVWLYDSGGAT